MSDSRFHLKVEFEVYGEKFKWDASLNWSADPGECDRRISEWFAERYDAAYQKYIADQDVYLAEERKKANEQQELRQLAELKLKYPDA